MTNTEAWVYAQQSVLGSILIDGRCAPSVMRETSENHFLGPQLTIYRAIRQLFQQGDHIDPVVVLDKVGNDYRKFVMELMEVTPTSAHVERYCQICREQAKAYKLRELGQQMSQAEDPQELTALVETASSLMANKPGVKIMTMDESMSSFMERHSKERVSYLQWPFKDMNNHIFTEPGDLIVIGSEPSVGKTALALQCARHFARNRKVGFFSLETSPEKLFDRMAAGCFELDMGSLKRNKLFHEDWDRVCSRGVDVSKLKLEIISASGWTVADIRATTIMQGYEVIIVDYLQLVSGPGENRPAVVTAVSLGLHTLAQSLGVTVIALSQLTVDNERKGTPGIDSLRESRQIGQDADVVMMLTLKDRAERSGPRNLTVQKNKEGRLSNTVLYFDGSRQLFSKQPPKEAPEQKGRPVAGQMEMLPIDTEVPFND